MAAHHPVFPLPSAGELVEFEHGAAGHQGISSNAAGDLIIKPCTQAELDFYEAARSHPEFQAHMPVFMGQIELGNKTGVPVAGADIQALASAPMIVTSAENDGAGVAQGESEQTATSKAERRQTKVWMPSGGAKLQTGLAIVLENAAASFKKPNVLDLKLGSRLWDDNAPEEKRKKLDEVAAETTSGSLGFRVAGAKIWLGERASQAEIEVNTEVKDGYKSWNKHYGRNLDEQSVQKAIARFLSGTMNPAIFGRDKSQLGSPEAGILAKRLLKEVENIEYVLSHQESRMYSASILVVIEGDQEALKEAMEAENQLQQADASKDASEEAGDGVDEDDDEDEESVISPKVLEVRIIDFAHAAFTPGQGPDENALKGVRSIINILKEISN